MVKQKIKCSLCKQEIDKLEVFSKGECLKCHEKEWDKMSKKAKDNIPMFNHPSLLNV